MPPRRLLQPLMLCLMPVASLFCPEPLRVSGEEPGPWLQLETRYTVISYRSSEDLRKLSDNIRYRSRVWKTGGGSSLSPGAGRDSGVAAKVDALCERVQEILDMRRRIEKTNIRIYPDERQLHEAHQGLYREPCHVRAWYSFETNTVFLNANDLKEGILAHELAHSIIDHYLLIRPPAATAEILARYVDGHLRD